MPVSWCPDHIIDHPDNSRIQGTQSSGPATIDTTEPSSKDYHGNSMNRIGWIEHGWVSRAFYNTSPSPHPKAQSPHVKTVGICAW